VHPTLPSALQSFLFLTLPVWIYVAVLRWRKHIEWREIADRLGLRAPPLRYVAWGLAFSVLSMCFSVVSVRFGIGFSDQGSPIHFLVGMRPTPELIWASFLYAFIATGIGEELLFRGLIAGVLRRRIESETLANLLQALIFTAPHALILIVRPDLWSVLLVIPVLALILGWLRFRSKSVLPSALVHSLGNFAVALATMAWS